MSTPIVLDVDTGIDDTIALLFAALHPEVELIAAGAVWGNVEVETATRNTLHAGPLSGRPAVHAHHVHGDDGQGNAGDRAFTGTAAPIGAAEQIVSVARARPGQVELVATGPLTNVALALGLCPELPRLFRGVTIMGGAALAPGNVTPVAEANVWCDPEAAHAVFGADWLLTVVLPNHVTAVA